MARQPRPKGDDALRATIRAAGLRVTPGRIAVLKLLQERGRPMSHAEVASELEGDSWDRATVYRNLIDLVRAELVRRTDVGDHTWRFERREEQHGKEDHPHFVCSDCGSVECLPEIELSVKTRSQVPRALRKRRVEVQLKGLCDDCS